MRIRIRTILGISGFVFGLSFGLYVTWVETRDLEKKLTECRNESIKLTKQLNIYKELIDGSY